MTTFFEYYSHDRLVEAHIIEGLLWVNPQCVSDAFVKVLAPYMLPMPTPSGGGDSDDDDDNGITSADIFIKGAKRNRAIHGDRVYVEILPRNQWEVSPNSAEVNPWGVVVGIKQRAKLPIHCVVRNNRYSSTGRIEDELRIHPDDKVLRAVPVDKKYPWFLVSQKDFVSRFREKLESRDLLPEFAVFSLRMVDWKVKSKLPLGETVHYAGDCLETNYETAAALEAFELEYWAEPLPPVVDLWAAQRVDAIRRYVEELGHAGGSRKGGSKSASLLNTAGSEFGDWDEITLGLSREDLRDRNVISIDPETARDLDDAIHVKDLGTVWEVGIHIADVSFVIPPSSPADLEARKRTTTVYFPNRAWHMLPRSVCQELCSIDPSGDKLAFTVLTYFDKKTLQPVSERCETTNGRSSGVYRTRFLKSIVKNKCRLNYDQVQDFLDGEIAFGDQEVEEVITPFQEVNTSRRQSGLVDRVNVEGCFAQVRCEFGIAGLKQDLLVLHKLTKQLRRDRFAAGSVHLSSLQLKFLCNDVGLPDYIAEESHCPSHWMIEELMLLANCLVAEKIAASPIADWGVLRVHPSVKQLKALKLCKRLTEICPKLQVSLQDFSNATSVASLLKKVAAKTSPRLASFVEHLIIINLEQAVYRYAARTHSHHFALGFDQYTHFTSPIRRYADLLVHRQLTLALVLEQQHPKSDGSDWRGTADHHSHERMLGDYMKRFCHLSPNPYDDDLQHPDDNFQSEEEEEDVLDRVNDVRIRAKRASERASDSWLLMFLSRQPAPVFTTSTVELICDRSLKIHLPDIHSEVRVEFEVCESSISTRKFRKIRQEHLAQVKLPTLYTVTNLPDDDNEDEEQPPASCTIRWADGQELVLMTYDALPVWILPSREVPLTLVAVPVPPSMVKAAERRTNTLRNKIVRTVIQEEDVD